MTTTYYDPDHAPDPREWLALDEQERIRLAQNYHVSVRARLPNLKAHAVFHAVVENQIALGYGPSCRAVERLQREGLSRHEAIHAIASVVAAFAHESLNGERGGGTADAQNRIITALETLTASAWKDSVPTGRAGG